MKKLKFLFCFLLVFSTLYSTTLYATSNDQVNEKNKYDLKTIAGYEGKTTDSTDLSSDEVTKTILNDLIIELRPYLKGIVDENIDENYIFTTKEVLNIVVGHPIEFITAIFNYAINSIKEVFEIASANAVVVE